MKVNKIFNKIFNKKAKFNIMIKAKWNENEKYTVCEVTGNIKSIINEFGTIIDTLMKEDIVDIVLKILAKVVKDNNLDDQLIDSYKKSINDLIK